MSEGMEQRGKIIVPGLVAPSSARSPVFDPGNLPQEVRDWGALVGWLRAKEYSPSVVRELIEAHETKENDDALAGD